jgi:hypothetical protein
MANKGTIAETHLLGIETDPKIASAPTAVKLLGCGIRREKAANITNNRMIELLIQFLFIFQRLFCANLVTSW